MRFRLIAYRGVAWVAPSKRTMTPWMWVMVSLKRLMAPSETVIIGAFLKNIAVWLKILVKIFPPLQEKYVYLQLETQQYLHYETSYTLGSRSGFLNLGVSLPDQPIRQGGLWRNL